MEHRRVCFCMLSLLPLVQISKLSQANSLLFGKVCCRTPRGVRGLKFGGLDVPGQVDARSHPSRGAWIEITTVLFSSGRDARRTPRGVRELKCNDPVTAHQRNGSHPSRGAWIEMPLFSPPRVCFSSRTPRGVRGLKFFCLSDIMYRSPGRTPRGVRGLKLIGSGTNWEEGAVAPLAGCVD